MHTLVNSSTHFVDEPMLLATIERCATLERIEQPIHVLLTDDEHIQRLNQKWRAVDAPTDVLTFPSGQRFPFPKGDLAVSVPYASRQAQARGVTLDEELVALIVHGVLHLSGYDDEAADDRQEMQHRMNEIGGILGTPIEAEWTSVLHGESE